MTENIQADGTAVIKFDKAKYRGRVRGAVNGAAFDFPVGQDVTVTEGQLNALRDSNVSFSTVSPLAGEASDEGSSDASTTVTGTAMRMGEDDDASTKEGQSPSGSELAQGSVEGLAPAVVPAADTASVEKVATQTAAQKKKRLAAENAASA